MKEKSKIILVIIMIFAVLLRIVFVSKNNIAKYQNDVGIVDGNNSIDYESLYTDFNKEQNEARHINYIMHLYTYGSLPTEILGQFYHPPLHHFVMATWLHAIDLVSDSAEFKFESMQIVTLVYSVVILYALYKILEELEIQNKIIPMLLFGFYPLYIFMSGSINNDELVTMFATLCLLYLIRWSKNPSMKNTILVSSCIGFGLMTKTSMFVMIIPAIYVYFKTLIDFVNKDKKVGKLLVELLVFTIISTVFGLWFQIRSFINGLNTLGIIEPYEYLSTAYTGVWTRFGIGNFLIISPVNIWNYLLQTSLNFGFVLLNTPYMIIMVIITLTLAIDTIYYIVKYFKKEKLLIITFITWWAFYFYLNIQMPYTCSMHARYMAIPISIGIILLGKGVMEEKNKLLKIQIYVSSISVCLMSVFMNLFLI